MATTNAPAHYYTADDKSEYINEIYEQQRLAQQAALEAAYNEQVSAFDRQAEKIPGLYRAAKNATSSDAEISRANLNESLASTGLNTGAGGQAKLAQSNVLQGNLSALDAERASKLADLEAERALAHQQYQLGIAQAIADNEYQRAQMLYNEAVRVDESYTKASSYYGGSSSSSGSSGGAYQQMYGNNVTDVWADGPNIINVPKYGEISYDDAEWLEQNGYIRMSGRGSNGDPIYSVLTGRENDTYKYNMTR